MSRLLINESPLTFQPSLAVAIGLNEAIVLQQIHYWINNSRNKGYEQDGFKWVYNTYKEWQENNFPFWSENTIQRVFASLEEKGLVISIQPMKSKYDRTKYYRIDYPKLDIFDDPKDIPIEDTNLVSSLNVSEITAENTTKGLKKGDLIDGIFFYGNQAVKEQIDKIEEVIVKLERGLRVNITRSTNNQAVARRILKDGRSLETWLGWVTSDEWRNSHLYIYADLEKVWRDFPQAFDNVNGYNPQGLTIS